MGLRPEGGVRGSKKSLSGFGPARRAGPDDILKIDFARTVREKIEVNFCPKINVNLKKQVFMSPSQLKAVLIDRSYQGDQVFKVSEL